MTDEDGWTEHVGQGIAGVLSASVVDLPQGRYVRLEVKSDPPVRLDMEPDGALWLAQKLLDARSEAQGRDVGFPVKTLLMLGGDPS